MVLWFLWFYGDGLLAVDLSELGTVQTRDDPSGAGSLGPELLRPNHRGVRGEEAEHKKQDENHVKGLTTPLAFTTQEIAYSN